MREEENCDLSFWEASLTFHIFSSLLGSAFSGLTLPQERNLEEDSMVLAILKAMA